MRTHLLLPPILPLLALLGCQDSVKVDLRDDTAIGIDGEIDDTGDTDDTEDTDSTAEPDIDVDPLTLDLGSTAPGVPVSATFTVSNFGDGLLDAAIALASGTETFAVDVTDVSLAADASTVVSVTFVGDAEGLYTGQIAISSNDPDEATVVVFVGAGVVAADDDDGDGYFDGEDCNDNDPSVNPGAEDAWYDGVDSNCDGADDYDQDGDGYRSSDHGGDDCDDAATEVNPGTAETWYDGVDADCDGRSDFDADGDGYDAAEHGGDDCDDADPGVSPGTLEVEGDGLDNDCDGTTDELLETVDHDGDGYAEVDGDCDDSDASVHPDAVETWYDGIDADCDGASDYDQDGDGYESDAYGGDDCDDTDAAVNPGAVEILGNGLDDDCEGVVDGTSTATDRDGDGYDDVAFGGTDCDDTDGTINPGAVEVWYDGVDSDCDGANDYDQDGDGYESSDYYGEDCDDLDASVSPAQAETWYDGIDADCDGASDYDQDGDGQEAAAWGGADCDDTDPGVYLGATEDWYDGVDADCSGGSDYDQDGDGYDDAAYGGTDCDDLDTTVNPGSMDVWYDGIDSDCDGADDFDQDGDGYTSSAYGGDDCDDLDASVSPAATEVWYDGVDGDCDGASDYDQDGDGQDAEAWGGVDCEDEDGTIYLGATEVWYDGTDGDCSGGSDYDQDGDGHDALAHGGLDCDDTDAGVGPDAVEVWYDGVDGDCSGGSDYDQDGDGVTSSDWGGFDCDDTDATIYPAATEVCDSVDNDCDGSTDEGVTSTWYLDGDSDGYGLSVRSVTACTAPSGYAASGGDCDDSLSSVNPGAAETCNGRDDDCDGVADNGVTTTWYLDGDADGYGTTSTTYASCSAPAGYVAAGTDCDDGDGAISPAATEVCDGVDQDCDGVVDNDTTGSTYYADADGDGYGDATTSTTACSAPSGYVSDATDCLDSSGTVYPGAPETCNGVDDDCDGTVDDGTSGTSTYYADADGDGYGDASVSTTACSAPSGYVTDATDCDDTRATTNPGAPELAYDAEDNDCDDIQDEMVALVEASYTILGDGAGDAIGAGGVWVADDLDGDGEPELVVGSAEYDYSTSWGSYTAMGLVAFHDVDTFGSDVAVTDGYYAFYGNSSDDYMGQAFAVLDDLDGDGATEVAFGAYQNNWDSTDDGTVYINDIDGESGSDFASGWSADGAIAGTSSGGHYGYSLAAGDFDGDGNLDLAAGAPGESSSRGRVYVTFDNDDLGTDSIDNDDSTFYMTGVSSSDYLGRAVAFGDFNDDGYDDLVASSPYDDDNGSASGTVWIIAGASTRDTSSVSGTTVSSLDTAVITGSAASDYAGFTPQSLSVGDFDGDNVDDLAVGVPGYDGYTSAGGGIWVYLGGTLSGSETVSTASYVVNGDGSLGTAVNLTGDVTGDGIVDLLGGATTAGSNYGVVYLLDGGRSTGTYTFPTDQYASWTGEASGDAFGAAISGLRDLDGDGRMDFAVAATGNDDAGSAAGKVYVLPAYP